MSDSNCIDADVESAIAIIGIAGRFPGARNVEEFWNNLKGGVESISFFADDELEAYEESASLLTQPNFVKAKGILDDVEGFDAAFFGFNPREAELLDPQHRVFLECAWHALEDAGYDSSNFSGRIAVYAGASTNTYLLNIYSNRSLLESIDPFQLLISSDKDFLTTRVSYKLGLSGPSVTVQTACSTALVAVHLACQSLLAGESDIGLAGGVSITLPQRSGYLYQEGSFLSPDGHCRAFDVDAGGTVSGNGAGIVVLKRLEDALADRDHIYAVIRGSAINNDAAMKAGYTAPSVTAQATVIAEALAVAGIEPGSVSYVETHGTGTALGDPVEMAALTKAFRRGTQKVGYCGIGSVKTNIGHLDAAAGAAGLIKVAMSLSERKMPPSLHFKRPNPQLNLESSPFYVNNKLAAWESSDGRRRAGISSFGIGGTNAHVVLEEAPPISPSEVSSPHHLLIFSAKTDSALDRATIEFANYLRKRPNLDMADAAYTLQVGRRHFEQRRFLVCADATDAAAALEQPSGSRVITSKRVKDKPPVVFLFPGQGSQYINMGRDLYGCERVFREQFDYCACYLAERSNIDLREAVYPEQGESEAAARTLRQTEVAQPALFAIEYAAAKWWMSLGVTPAAMIGHSIGEYVAACIAGVFSLEDSLALVAARGRLMQQMPAGRMIAAALSEADARTFIDGEVSIAAVNGPSLCVLSGPAQRIGELQARLSAEGVRVTPLHTSHAFHSPMMEPVLKQFEELVRSAKLLDPDLRFVSNVSGSWITADQARSPAYWAAHLRQTVRFSEGLALLASGRPGVFLEVGPGSTLATLARNLLRTQTDWEVTSTLPSRDRKRSDVECTLESVGKLWLSGVKVDWGKLYGGAPRNRISLPGYPFERKRYWIDFHPDKREAEPGRRAEKPSMPSVHERPASLASEYTVPASETEQTLAEIWQEVFGIEKVGIHDDFFALGGHSLLATQLIAEVREAFDIDLPLQKLFQSPTIVGLAFAVEEALIRKVDQLTEDEVQDLLR